MTSYSVESRDQIFVKGYGFLPFVKTKSRNISKNISKNLSIEYSWKLIDHTKQSGTSTLKTASERAIQTTAETTGNLIGNKLLVELQKSKNNPPQNNEEEIFRERYISRTKTENYWWSKINIIIFKNGVSKNN